MKIRRFEGKNKNDVLKLMYRLANEAIKRDNGRIEQVIWDICYDWNSQHEEEEIFMSDYENEEETRVGFMIEDDYWVYEA